MKKAFAAFCCALLLLLATAKAIAAEEKPLRVGITDEESRMMVPATDAYGDMIRASLNEVAKYSNWSFEYAYGTEAELLEQLKAGRLDFIAGVYEREALAQDILYPQYLTGYTYAYLVASPENSGIQQNDFRSIRGKRIATVSASAGSSRLLGYLALNNINGTTIYTSSQDSALEKLRAGEVDMALVDAEHVNGYRVVSRFVVDPFYVVASKNASARVLALDNAYELIYTADPLFAETLSTKEGEQSLHSSRPVEPEETDFIKNLEPVKIAVADNLSPFQYYDENGDARGISVDILKALQAGTEIPFTFVRAKSVVEAREMVEQGSVDAMLDIVLRSNTENTDVVLTNPLLETNRIVVCNKYISYPAEGMTLALLPGMEHFQDAFAGTVVYGDTFRDCVAMVNNGTADYTYGATYFVEYGMGKQVFRNVQMLTLPDQIDQVVLAFRKPVQPRLLSLVNKGLHGITDESLQEIVLRNTALQESRHTLQSFIYAYPMLVIVLLLILTVLVIAIMVIMAILRARHSQELYKSQYTDELTGALNLQGYRREAVRLLQTKRQYAVSYGSVRNFQFINDQYGFEDGDYVLKQITQIYRGDMRENEIFCRISGGTFSALRLYETKAELEARLDRFHAAVHELHPQMDPSYHVKMVFGVYLDEEEECACDIFGMMDRANAIQQQISNSAEKNFAFYQKGVFDGIMRMQEMESKMEAALEREDFRVFMQPKYDLETMKPGGAEALVRWLDNGKMVPPGEFIPQFEKNGFISRLDRYVFTQTCKAVRRWLDEGMPVVPISINVSRVLLDEENFISDYTKIKHEYNIPDGLLELEFTEGILFDDVEKLIDIVQTLHKNGFPCSIDDFGKGYSSLTMLKNIPADTIKMDAQFFEAGLNERRDTVVIESVIGLAKALGMTTLAEGIETKEQVQYLHSIGCNMIQGYVFSKPVDIPTFERYLHEKVVEGRDPYAPLA